MYITIHFHQCTEKVCIIGNFNSINMNTFSTNKFHIWKKQNNINFLLYFKWYFSPEVFLPKNKYLKNNDMAANFVRINIFVLLTTKTELLWLSNT
jgi:hypothetical protein